MLQLMPRSLEMQREIGAFLDLHPASISRIIKN